jgi:DNA-binding GntR family transcriptional regulator
VSTTNLSQILAPTTKRSLSDEVVERLRTAIICGQLAPDEPLREASLAESLGVSRGPVREALRRLEREGLVITRPNGRTSVARLSRQDLDEVFSLRTALEQLAIEFACRHATPTDLAELQTVVDTMAACIERGITEQEAAELDLSFHDLMCRISGHGRLSAYWQTLRPQIYVFMLSRNVASADFNSVTVRGHRELVDAIEAGDATQATSLIEGHLAFAYQLIIESYEQPCPE